ncbi:hypothetical protein TRAPUB_11406 [Trametes pubescens]|uniref:Uncharacterized protein n=1 Tax=Trametes pubescens TaxID=154538 RepID=A0A1M2VWS7_TRAPU|nr:hypothetical protein TRAPUB_11406 [Trametes pubescens]
MSAQPNNMPTTPTREVGRRTTSGRDSPSYAEVVASPRSPTPTRLKTVQKPVNQTKERALEVRVPVPAKQAVKARDIAKARAEPPLTKAGSEVGQRTVSPPTPSPAPKQALRLTGPAVGAQQTVPNPPLEASGSPYATSVDSSDYRDSKYPSPTLTDWRNLSVHGNDSMTTENVKDVIGESCADGDQIEDAVTDRIDRYGRKLPGYDEVQAQLMEHARKRQRVERSPSPDPKPRVISVKFRKYRALPPPGTKKSTHTSGRVKQWLNTAELPEPVPVAPTGSGKGKGRQTDEPDAPRGSSRGPPRAPSPHLRDEDYLGPAEHTSHYPPAARDDMEVDAAALTAALQGVRGRDSETQRQPQEYVFIQEHPGKAAPTPMQRFAFGSFDRADTSPPPETPVAGPSNGAGRAQPGQPPRGANKAHATIVLPSVLGVKSAGPGTPVRALPGQNAQGGWFTGAPPTPAWNGGPAATPGFGAQRVLPVLPSRKEYHLTAAPDGGFPEIHHPYPESLIADLEPDRVINMWGRKEEEVLLLFIHNMGTPKAGQSRPLTEEVTNLVNDRTGEEGFVVVAPQPVWTPTGRVIGAPKTWAIYGLKSENVTLLVELGTASSDRITAHFFRRILYIPKCLYTAQGYCHNTGNDIQETIRSAFNKGPIYDSILSLVQGNPEYDHLQPHEAATLVVASLVIRVDVIGNQNLQAVIFCDTPTASADLWRQWRQWLMDIPFRSLVNPPSYAKPIETCPGCHSADHTAHMCRFPLIQGWNAPPPGSGMYGRHQMAGNGAANQASYVHQPALPHAPLLHAPQHVPLPGWAAQQQQQPWAGGQGNRGGRGRGGNGFRGARGGRGRG